MDDNVWHFISQTGPFVSIISILVYPSVSALSALLVPEIQEDSPTHTSVTFLSIHEHRKLPPARSFLFQHTRKLLSGR